MVSLPHAHLTNGFIRALLIEDNPDDADWLKQALAKSLVSNVDLVCLRTLPDGIEELGRREYDVVLLDLLRSDLVSFEGLHRLRAAMPRVAIIILTGLEDQEVALTSLKNGAQDYLNKGKPSGESIYRAMRYAIERKRSEEMILDAMQEAQKSASAAHEVQAKLELALKASETGVWSWDIFSDHLELDDQVLKAFGLKSSFFGTNHELFLDRIHAKDRPLVDAAFGACRKGKADFDVEYRVVWPDGTTHLLSMMGCAVFDLSGAPNRIAGVCRDVTKSKQQEQDSRRLALLEQRQEFIAMLAHDLRTPILGCQRIMSLMIDGSLGALTESQVDLLSKMSDSNQSMLLMIGNVLDSYRFEAGAESVVCTEMDLQSLILSCLVELAPLAQKNDISLVHKVSKTKTVLADQIAMRRVVCNLVSNAIKFTPAGGSIEIKVVDRQGRAILQVKDTGVGMSVEEMSNLFQRFWQARGQYRARGLGLGLYLCRHLVEAQSSTILCQSEVGKGTTFEVSLPYATFTPPRILIVDDTPISGMLLRRFLEKLSIIADTVTGGEEALEKIRTTKYSAIFVDLMMPGMDGFSTASAMRAAGVDTPLLAYSAQTMLENIEEFKRVGFSDVIEKPVNNATLRTILDKWLGCSL